MAVRTLCKYVCSVEVPGERGGGKEEDGTEEGGGLRSVVRVVHGVLLYVSRCWGLGD